jgi:hypothetical protein
MHDTFGSLLHSYYGFANTNEHGCTIVNTFWVTYPWRHSHPNGFTITYSHPKTRTLIWQW